MYNANGNVKMTTLENEARLLANAQLPAMANVPVEADPRLPLQRALERLRLLREARGAERLALYHGENRELVARQMARDEQANPPNPPNRVAAARAAREMVRDAEANPPNLVAAAVNPVPPVANPARADSGGYGGGGRRKTKSKRSRKSKRSGKSKKSGKNRR